MGVMELGIKQNTIISLFAVGNKISLIKPVLSILLSISINCSCIQGKKTSQQLLSIRQYLDIPVNARLVTVLCLKDLDGRTTLIYNSYLKFSVREY